MNHKIIGIAMHLQADVAIMRDLAFLTYAAGCFGTKKYLSILVSRVNPQYVLYDNPEIFAPVTQSNTALVVTIFDVNVQINYFKII